MHWVRLQVVLGPVASLCRPKQQFLCLSRSFLPTYDYGRLVLRESRKLLLTSRAQCREQSDDVERDAHRRRKRQGVFVKGWQFRKLTPPSLSIQNLWMSLTRPLMPSYTTSVSCTVGTSSTVVSLRCGMRRGFHSSTALWVTSHGEGEEGDNAEESRDDSSEEHWKQDEVGEEYSAEELGGERRQESLDKQSGEVQLQPEKTAGEVGVAGSSASMDTSGTGGYSLKERGRQEMKKSSVW